MDEPITGINVTPLIDIVLVLLIVLMVALGYLASQQIPVSLAGAGGEPARTLALELDASGAITLDGQPVARDALKARLQALEDPEAVSAAVRADARSSHGAVVGLLDLLRIEGVTRISFVRPR